MEFIENYKYEWKKIFELKLKIPISDPPLQRKECGLWETLKAVEWDLNRPLGLRHGEMMNGVNTVPKMRKPKLTARNRVI
jgi:hypothetical protein